MTFLPSSPAASPVTVDRRWFSVATAAASLPVVAYLALHGVGGAANLVAAWVAALGLLAVSVAAPHAARTYVRNRMGGARTKPHGNRVAAGRRWLMSQVAAVLATSALLGVWLVVVRGASPEAPVHALGFVLIAANTTVLLAHLVPLPGFSGWSLLLDVLRTQSESRGRLMRGAVRIGRAASVILALAALGAGFAAAQPLLAVGSVAVVSWGWASTKAALREDAAIWPLAGLRAGDVARPVVDQYREDEPLLGAWEGAEPRLALVVGNSGLVGVVGPRQMRRNHWRTSTRMGDVMVPIRAVRVVAASAPATGLASQLRRFGVALVWLDGELAGVDETSILSRAFAMDARRRAASLPGDNQL